MARVKCPKCFEVNADGAGSCTKCGAALPRIQIDAAGPPPQPPRQNQVPFHKGQVVANRYTILDLVGRGGMGCIFRVRDNVLGEEVALKTLLPQFGEDRMVVDRFFNEARIARRMAHPNIVRVHDIGSASNILYLSMEFIGGHSLRSVLDHQMPGQGMSLERTLGIFDELCAALEYAHQFTVHRDIKPENVMIEPDGRVKLMDFGISKLVANTRLTGASMVMGTPFYMSPEQIKNARDVDARSDIYSMGIMLYEMLTGNVPAGVPKPASQVSREIPAALDEVVRQCIEVDPAKRYQSASELRRAIRAVRKAVGMLDEPAQSHSSMYKRRAAPSPRKALGLGLAALVLLLTAGGLAGAEWRRRNAPPAPAVQAERPAKGAVAAIAEAVASLRDRAGALRDSTEAQDSLLQQAEARWEEGAALSPRDGRRLQLAQEAMQMYAAALLLPLLGEDMTFVPPGMVDIYGSEVYVPAFFIDREEVTIRAFREFAAQAPNRWRFPPELAAYGEEYNQYPITMVSLFDAQAYAAYRGKEIPTEAQWRRAAHGNDSEANQFPWGDAWEDHQANVAGAVSGYRGPMAVGSFEADQTWTGCMDMTGNVSEWTQTPADPAKMDGLRQGALPFRSEFMVKGGHWDAPPMPLSASSQHAFESRLPQVGFRCVRTLPSEPAAIEAMLTAMLP